MFESTWPFLSFLAPHENSSRFMSKFLFRFLTPITLTKKKQPKNITHVSRVKFSIHVLFWIWDWFINHSCFDVTRYSLDWCPMETLLLRSRLDGVDEDFIPQEPEEITREWLFAVINQYRKVRDLSLLAHPDDITDCSIDECDSSHGYLSTTYKLLANFHCKNPLGKVQLLSFLFSKF